MAGAPNSQIESTPLAPLGAAPDWTIQQRIYIWLTALASACLIISDVVGIKLFSIPLPFPIFGIKAIDHTCGMLAFPVTFLLTDLINEYYGARGARRVTYISLTMGLFVFVIMNIALAMPRLDAPFNVSEDAFQTVFGSSRIMYIASLVAYLIGQLCDITIFGVLKRMTGGRAIWLRATGSTVFSQMIDSFVVSYIAFDLGRRAFPAPGTPPAGFDSILGIAATGYLLKFALAIAITPLIYAGHGILRRWVGLRPVSPAAA